MKVFEKRALTKKSENISEWYHDIVVRAGLAEYSDMKGMMIIKPTGYALWESVQKTLDGWFKEDGVQNVYFPLFIPMSLLQKEKEHLEGFSPELAVVTHGGGEELAEPLAIRPTSETIMYRTFSNWIQSYRDLPLKINQWCNVVRWEKRTYPFLRTTEFLWQEGHTAHKDEQDAEEMALKALEWYRKFYREYFAIDPYVGLKSDSERFAGAKRTYAIEIVSPDGKSLQAATSHNLSDNFSKVFEVQYLDEKGQKNFVHQTSWGLSTRAIGALILTHGDDSGMVMPPKVAPIQAVILSIQEATNQYALELKNELSGLRVQVDTDQNHSLGYRINEWELKGVPLRIEIGPKEIEKNMVTLVRRDTFEKKTVDRGDILSEVKDMLDQIQSDLLSRSEKIKSDLTIDIEKPDQLKEIKDKVFIRVFWCEDPACEAKVKEETKMTSRVLELEQIKQSHESSCVFCGKKAHRKWLFAQSY